MKKVAENLKKELLAGITTFFTMSYILVVNPVILSAAGMPKEGVIFATAVSSAIATFLVGLWAGLPFALAPGMGLNAYFAYTCVKGMGISYETALTAVFLEGVIFLVLALFGFRKAIFRAIPDDLAYSISAGIGLFIAFIGLINSGIVVPDSNTIVRMGSVSSFPAIVTFVSLLVIVYLSKKKFPGAILAGIIFATIVAFVFKKADVPHGLFGFPFPSAAFKFDFASVFSGAIIPVVLTFLIVDVFDTVGTLTGLTARLGISRSDERVSKALTCDAVGTVLGGMLGTSTVTTYIESASGVAEGGKTGKVALVVSALFMLSLIFYPAIASVPPFATSSALIYVGGYMMASVSKIRWEDVSEAIPAFVTFLGIPLTFSISDGIGFGFITYVFSKLIMKDFGKLNFTVVGVAIVFLFKFLF